MPRQPLPNTHRELLDLLPDWSWTARDRRKTMRLIAARDALAAAEDELSAAVRDAYDGGDSWLTIGTILGISRQAAPIPATRRGLNPVRSERLELSLSAT